MNKKIKLAGALLALMMSVTSIVNAQEIFWQLDGNNLTSTAFIGTKIGNVEDIRFKLNGTQRMVIRSSNGCVGIGQTSPTSRLAVYSGGTTYDLTSITDNSTLLIVGLSTGANVSLDNDEVQARNNGTATNLYLNRFGGNVGIGTATPMHTLHVAGGDNTIQFGSAEYITDFGSNQTGFNASLLPINGCTYNLGSTSYAWQNLYLCGSVITLSDSRLKKEIANLKCGLAEIMQLRPVSYKLTCGDDDGFKLGLIAQEVQKIIPSIVAAQKFTIDEKTGAVKKEKSEYIGVSYSEIIPILIKGIQEQQAEIIYRDEKIARLEDRLNVFESQLNACCNNNKNIMHEFQMAAARLEQNAPNPFKETTIVKFNIPQTFKSAVVKIYSLRGEEMKSFKVNTSGEGQIEISANSMAAGVYQYTLLIDGKAVDSRQMIVTK